MKQNTYPAEMAVLGGLILNPNLFDEIQLQPYHFAGYTKVAETVWQMYGDGLKIDAMSVAAICERNGVCRSEAIFNLFAGSYVPQSFTQHCEQVESAWHSRMEIEIHEKALRLLKQGRPVDEVLGQVAAERETMEGEVKNADQTRVDRANDVLDFIYQARKKEKIPTAQSWPQVDAATGGWCVPERFTIIAARPGVGKTRFALNAAILAAEQGRPVAFFSLEMSYRALSLVYVQQETGIKAARMKSGDVTDSEMDLIRAAMAKLYVLPIYIETAYDIGSDITDIITRARRYKRLHGVEMVMIDYIQLLSDRTFRGYNRHEMMGGISRKLTLLAGTERLEVLALSQLSRDIEKRTGEPKPKLSDLAESGTLERDAWLVGFIYRPEKHGITEDSEGNSLKGVTLLYIAKNRENNDYVDVTIPLYYSYKHDRYNAEPTDEQPAPTYNALITTSAKAGDDDIPF